MRVNKKISITQKNLYMNNKLLLCLFVFFTISIKVFTQVSDLSKSVKVMPPSDQTQLNLNFENGLKNWTVSGTAFSNQPVKGNSVMSERVLNKMTMDQGGIGGDYWKGMSYPIGFKGNYWMGTYENGNGDAPIGTITSLPFTSAMRYITFLLGGGKDLNKLYVELQVKSTDYEAAWGSPRRTLYGQTEDGFTRVLRLGSLLNSEELFRYYFDLDELLNHQYQNKTYRIHIVDNKTAGWGHINVDDIQLSADLSKYLRITKDGFTLLADKDKPLWGFADTHTHPMNYLGFGAGIVYGSMFGPLDRVMGDCTPVHGGFATGGASAVEGFMHATAGHPTYEGFPRYNSKIHQQMHIDWIKRSYDGGLRMISMLAVNNWFSSTRFMKKAVDLILPTNALDPRFAITNLVREGIVPKDDKTSADLQILYFTAEIESDPIKYNWLEIARSPEDARRIIASNKMAVILGVELDMIGNFLPPDAPWGRADLPNVVNYLPTNLEDARRRIATELDRLWALGVRQISPFHYSETWGGTPLFQRMFNNVNREFTGKLYQVEDGTSYGINYTLDKDNGTDGLARFLTSGEIGNSHRHSSWNQHPNGQINALGLNNYGRILLEEIMKRGFLLDADHTSMKSFNDIVAITKNVRGGGENTYPIISSHTDPQELSLDIFSQAPPGDMNTFSRWTTKTGFIKHEAQASANKYSAINESGGIVAPLMSLYRKQPYKDLSGKVQIDNNADGSSRTWAQMYLYSLEKMGSKSVALSSDRGFIDFIAPRFGVHGAGALREENDVNVLKKEYRRAQVKAQSNGVRYDAPIRTYQHYRFDQWDNHYTGNENIMWRALASATVAKTQNKYYRDLDFSNSKNLNVSGVNYDAMELTDGILKAWNNQTFNLEGKGALVWGEWRAAAFAAIKFVDSDGRENLSNTLVTGFGLDPNKFVPIYNSFVEIYKSWKAMTGSNDPLRRHIVGSRDWDINLDGVAHYGMLPDFLQDVKNIGVKPSQLSVLFNSANDYIKTWEKAERMKVHVRLN